MGKKLHQFVYIPPLSSHSFSSQQIPPLLAHFLVKAVGPLYTIFLG